MTTSMVWPTALLVAAVAADAVARFIAPEDAAGGAEFVGGYLLSWVIANWLLVDARKRGRRLCYDYDSFLFFAWPVIGLAYLVQTRRWRAALTIFWFLLIILIPNILADVIDFVED